MTRHNLLVCAATAILALASAPAARAQTITTIIDDFSEEQLVIVSGAPTGVKSATGVVDKTGSNIILGNERDVKATRTSANKGVFSADFNQSVTGVFALTTSIGTKGNVALTYDGNDSDANALAATGLGGADLTASGGDSFFLSAASDLGGIVTITVYTGAADYSSATIPIAGNGQTMSLSPYLLPLSAFTVGGGSGANFTNVGAITLLVNANVADADFAFDVFAVANSTAVPEPGNAAFAVIAGTMVTGLILRHRRRRA